MKSKKHQWSSGRIVPCHGTDPGSIPGWCISVESYDDIIHYVMRGVRQFKLALKQKLAKDDASSVAARVKETDAQETESFYRQNYDQYTSLVDQEYQADRAQLGKLYQTSGVLFEVLRSANKTENFEVSPQVSSRL
ncbi:callose synthase 5 [Euphorbia peplus]|nr:callose synthase 5 [Euphorbia peplus]